MAIREVTVDYIWLVSLSYGSYGLVMSVNAAFNGIGRPLPGVLISSMRVVIVFLPLAYLGHWLFGLPGLFGASALSNLGIGALAYRWLGSQLCKSQR
jgi:Na+-driven multidrug efflux pump